MSVMDDSPCPALDSLSPERRYLVEQAASEYLYRWTGGVYGLCEVTVRPCRERCAEGEGTTYSGRTGTGFTPTLIGGSWFNVSCGICQDLCSCDYVSQIRLPGPVHEIRSVEIDGVLLPPESYRVDNGRVLVREDGGDWPVCQDLGEPAGSVGTWSVTYLLGAPVPAHGQLAAETLACELAKAVVGDQSCGLPKRFQSITRQGVTVAMLDSFDDIERGHTGIWVIDSWISSVRHRPRGYTVRSVDVPSPRPRRTTYPGA